MLRTLEFGFGHVQSIFVYLLHGLGWLFNPLQYLPHPNRGQNTGPEEEDGDEEEEENSDDYEDIEEETDNDENEPPDHDKENASSLGNPQNDLSLD